MALEIRDIRHSQQKPEVNRFLVVSGQTVVNGELVGIFTGGANQGQIQPYADNVANLVFLGIVTGDDVVGDGSLYAAVSIDGILISQGCVVAGSGSSAPLTAVYVDGTGSDPKDDLQVAVPGGSPQSVGILLEQEDGSTQWSVLLRPWNPFA